MSSACSGLSIAIWCQPGNRGVRDAPATRQTAEPAQNRRSDELVTVRLRDAIQVLGAGTVGRALFRLASEATP